MNDTENLLDHVKKLHFVGIGGSGMCPMAEILHHNGYRLTGSDMNESDTLERIRGYGKTSATRSASCILPPAKATIPSWRRRGRRAFPRWNAP